LQLSFENVLQHLLVDRQVGNDSLEPKVFVVQLLKAPHFRRHQTASARLPVEGSRLNGTRLAADLRSQNPGFSLLQNERLLRVREVRGLNLSVFTEPASRLPENSNPK
jgi:hypothetical protein